MGRLRPGFIDEPLFTWKMRLKDKHVAYLVEDGFEDLEFWVPLMRLQEEGARVTVVSDKLQTFSGKACLKATPDALVEQVNPDELDGVIVPGGWAPDKLRRSAAVLSLVRRVADRGKIVASICHGGWVLASAGIVRGRKATGSMGIKDDMVNAGAIWMDAPALRDGNFVWGRVVADIPDFCRELVTALEEQ